MNKKVRKLLAATLTTLVIGSVNVPAMAKDTINQTTVSVQKASTSELEQVYQAYADFLRKYQVAQANGFYKHDIDGLNQADINLEL